MLALASVLAAAADSPRPQDADAFVRIAVNNEIAANAHPLSRWRYLLTKSNSAGTKQTDIIETAEGLVGRLISLNGQPLAPAVERDEELRLKELKRDAGRMSAKLTRQERDRARVLRMVQAMPDALLFTFTGTLPGDFGDEAVYSFQPNPRYQPDSLETEVLHKMTGTLRIAIADKRLVKLDGLLESDVDVGMGLVGKVRKGGRLLLQQARIAPGSWEITALDLNVSGRALFKHLDISVAETAQEFRAVPPNMPVADAIDLLLGNERDPSSLPSGLKSQVHSIY